MSNLTPGKRPYEHDGPDSESKRQKPQTDPSPTASAPAPNGVDAEQKKRDAAERMAAIKARLKTSRPANASSVNSESKPDAAPATVPTKSTSNGAPDLEARKAEVQRKIAEMKAKVAAKRQEDASTASSANGVASAGSAQGSQPPQMSEREARIAEARARAARIAKQRNTNVPATPAPPPRQDGRAAKGGLGVGLHPSLMGDNSSQSAMGKGKAAQQGPKFSTTKGNQQPDKPKVNPYLAADEDEGSRQEQENDAFYDPNVAARKGGERKSKQLVFNERGKFMAQANALRTQARLEEIKRRIAAENRKVEIEEAGDKAFLIPAPPDVEWWDEGLLPENQNNYDDCLEPGRNKIEVDGSIVTALIQRPVLLQAPQDKLVTAPKPLMLTKVEQKKLRRQRRMADMKEEQAKIRLGLVEPPPPKVKKSNMMRVLGEQAVKDPTAVEARVNREIAQRAADHDRANEDRKLTKEQRDEKLKNQQALDEAKGVRVCVFRVNSLSSGKHRYQVDINAKQNALTGIVILHPEMNLIIVEGGSHSIDSYKKLMLNRVKWNENTMPLSNTPTTFTGGTAGARGVSEASGQSRAAEWLNPLDEHGELKDLSENKCELVWEGDEQTRSFRKWGSKACETDGEARDVLSRQKMENMWTLARSK